MESVIKRYDPEYWRLHPDLNKEEKAEHFENGGVERKQAFQVIQNSLLELFKREKGQVCAEKLEEKSE